MKIKIIWRTMPDGTEQCYASIKTSDRTGSAACGESEAEAIGNLIVGEEEFFGIEIEREEDTQIP